MKSSASELGLAVFLNVVKRVLTLGGSNTFAILFIGLLIFWMKSSKQECSSLSKS